MLDFIFDLSYDRLPGALLAFVPAILNWIILAYASLKVPNNKLSFQLKLVLLTMSMWQLATTLVRLSSNIEAANFWFDIEATLSYATVISCVYFAFVYTKKEKITYSKIFIVILFVPFIFHMIMISYGAITFNLQPHNFWGWISDESNNTNSFLSTFFLNWISIKGIFVAALLIHFTYKSRHDRSLFIQSRLITLGFLFPISFGIITHTIFPVFLDIKEVPHVTTTFSTFSVAAFVGLTKYKIFHFIPELTSKQIIDEMQEGLFITDLHGKVQFVNSRLCQIISMDKASTLGIKFEKLIASSDVREAIIPLKEKVQGLMQFEVAIYKKDETLAWGLLSVSPILDNKQKPLAFLHTLTEITQQIKTQQAIKDNEEKYKLLIDKMHDGLVYVDTKGIIQFVNHRFCDIVGYQKNELIGQDIKDIGLNEKSRVLAEDALKRRIEGKSDGFEQDLIRKTGEKISVLNSGSPLIDEAGDMIGSIGIITDITQHKKIEKELKVKNEELNTFVYKSSHDMRGPLASIIGITNLAKKEADTIDKAKEYFSMINTMTSRLDNILVELAQVAKMSYKSVNKEKIDIENEIKEIIKSLGNLDKFDRIDFNINVISNKDFYSDKNLITSIIQNLIHNAIIYHDYLKEKPFINISVEDYRNGFKITIEDNGQGMMQETKEKAFEMFFRGNNEIKGSGLGLYIVKSALNKLDADIKIDSELKKGSKFTILLGQ